MPRACILILAFKVTSARSMWGTWAKGRAGPCMALYACGLLPLLAAGSSEAAQSSAACAPRRLPAALGVAHAALARRAGRVAHGG